MPLNVPSAVAQKECIRTAYARAGSPMPILPSCTSRVRDITAFLYSHKMI
jgi:hypothetical protein